MVAAAAAAGVMVVMTVIVAHMGKGEREDDLEVELPPACALVRQHEQHMLVDDTAPVVVEGHVAEVGEAGDEQHTLLRPPLRVAQPVLR